MLKRIFKRINSYRMSIGKVYFGKFELSLPSNHKLPGYLRIHRKYDRFLPFLVAFLEKNETVIDVGANCGDTLASLVSSNSRLNYICIEPDAYFFSFLEKNTNALKLQFPKSNILNLNILVGDLVDNVSLDGVGGTKNAVPSISSNAIKSLALDEIIKSEISDFCQIDSIRLIKSDVDGFDWDVLGSCKELIIKNIPLLYFECQFNDLDIKNRFSDLILYLKNNGYSWFVLFDNFGQVVVRTNDINIVENMFDYVWLQNTGFSTRTINYYDVLAYSSRDYELVENIISKYKKI